MANALLESVMNFFGHTVPAQVTAFIISTMPILELRLGIISARMLSLPAWQAYIICVIGTMLPVPFILLFIKQIFKWMKSWGGVFRKMVLWLERKANKGGKKIQKIKKGGIVVLAAIPLPGAGAWTSALAAAFLEVSFKEAVFSIFLGSLIAGGIMLSISYGLF